MKKRAERRASVSDATRPNYGGSMPRAPRLQIPGGLYHITGRGNRRQRVFADDQDRRLFLGLLDIVIGRLGWRCHSYCLMPNHYHLVAETPEPDLSRGMQELNSRYASSFNWRYRLDGHLFQGRFSSVLIEREEHFLETARYLVLNRSAQGSASTPRSGGGAAIARRSASSGSRRSCRSTRSSAGSAASRQRAGWPSPRSSARVPRPSKDRAEAAWLLRPRPGSDPGRGPV